MSGLQDIQQELERLRVLLSGLEWMGCQPHVTRNKPTRLECQRRMSNLRNRIQQLEQMKTL